MEKRKVSTRIRKEAGRQVRKRWRVFSPLVELRRDTQLQEKKQRLTTYVEKMAVLWGSKEAQELKALVLDIINHKRNEEQIKKEKIEEWINEANALDPTVWVPRSPLTVLLALALKTCRVEMGKRVYGKIDVRIHEIKKTRGKDVAVQFIHDLLRVLRNIGDKYQRKWNRMKENNRAYAIFLFGEIWLRNPCQASSYLIDLMQFETVDDYTVREVAKQCYRV